MDETSESNGAHGQRRLRPGIKMLAFSLLVAGFLLTTDYMLLKIVAFSTILSGRGLMRVSSM